MSLEVEFPETLISPFGRPFEMDNMNVFLNRLEGFICDFPSSKLVVSYLLGRIHTQALAHTYYFRFLKSREFCSNIDRSSSYYARLGILYAQVPQPLFQSGSAKLTPKDYCDLVISGTCKGKISRIRTILRDNQVGFSRAYEQQIDSEVSLILECLELTECIYNYLISQRMDLARVEAIMQIFPSTLDRITCATEIHLDSIAQPVYCFVRTCLLLGSDIIEKQPTSFAGAISKDLLERIRKYVSQLLATVDLSREVSELSHLHTLLQNNVKLGNFFKPGIPKVRNNIH
ncbi:uncharacterized protein V1516DRAFT_664425 [Lipomyces oligophaga]|uniref:uncharacterized protein n=1 Tax=Lipomyces oligophaga TaxID=45792 RepID=UPI0034CE6039